MRILFFAILSFSCNYSISQLVGTGLGSGQTTRRMEVYSWAERPDEDGTDIRKKFIKREWMAANVKFKSGRPDMQVPLIFDMYNDMPYYMQHNVIMEFVDSVSEFSMKVPYKKDSITMRYKRFYPALQANTSATFYQVLVEGKIELLKCWSKSILLFKDPDMPGERKKDPEFLYFAFMPGGKIAQIKPDAETILKNMQEYDWVIREVMKREKLKPKDEEKLIELFVLLHNELQ
ncbi:MAG: hypothetical protein ACT4OJ_03725 [Bacteroidota bacterium]